MANQSISQLTSATTPLNGNVQLPIVQVGETKKATAQDVSATAGSPIFFSNVISFGDTSCADVNMWIGYFPEIYSAVTQISAPNLVTINGSLRLDGNNYSALDTISFPLLQTVSIYMRTNVPSWDDNSIHIGSFDLLQSVAFPSLTRTDGSIEIQNLSILTSVNLSALQTYNSTTGISITTSPSLTTINISSLTTYNADFYGNGNALSQASVDAILYQLAVVVNLQNLQIDLSGGSNAAPSVTGQGYVTTLTNNGCTVLTN